MKTPFYALAPMADTSTYPFASQCMDFGADLVWTPMVHTDLALNNWEEARKVIDFNPSCHFDRAKQVEKSDARSLDKLEMTEDIEIQNYIIQIVGSEPEKFAQTIKLIGKSGIKPVGFDINAGCPDKNIVKSGCGGSLIKYPDLIVEIIKACKSATTLPISVKTRAGFENLDEIFELAPKLIEAGIWMLSVHPRTVKQAYTGQADWGVIKRLKEECSKSDVLIVGSGDVRTWQEATARQAETNCDGVMIGRGALGGPWIFREIQEGTDICFEMSDIKKLALDLAEKANAIWGERGITEAKKHFAAYFRGMDGAKEIRMKLMEAKTIEDVRIILSR